MRYDVLISVLIFKNIHPLYHTSYFIDYLPTYTGCPTRYHTRHFFNNFTTNEDIATKFEADLPHCVRNVTTS